MSGARTALGGPAEELLLAYRGTAYFLRALFRMSAHDFDDAAAPHAPENRRRTIATVGYDARTWAQLSAAVRTGDPEPAVPGAQEREEAIALAATLPPRALRHLVEHSATHLRVEWRDLPAEEWARQVRVAPAATRLMSDIPWSRAVQVWTAAVDLGTGASFSDFPRALLDRLIRESGEQVSPVS